MTIRSFAFEDTRNSWELEEFQLDELNLLVGLSGVGKTRTLASLYAVCSAASGERTALHGCRWKISVQTSAGLLTWTAETAAEQSGQMVLPGLSHPDSADPYIATPTDSRNNEPLFLDERLHAEDGRLILSRTKRGIQIENDIPIRLKGRESAISLFRSDDRVAPIHSALRRVRWSPSHRWPISSFDSGRLDRAIQLHNRLESLQEDSTLSILEKAYVLQRNMPDCFETFKSSYTEIFETVTEIQIDRADSLAETPSASDLKMLDLAIKEDGVDGWIRVAQLSSGMRRTMLHLLDLTLAPRGTVILVDEYENSMGVNCLPAVTNHILDRSRDLQFIITSHHPYVISNIDKEWWKIVTRRGHSVKIIPASSIPSLNTSSNQKAFIQLMNASEYEAGIS